MKIQSLEGYRAARQHAAWIDRTEQIGLLSVSGLDRFSWLQGMVSNDVRLLEQGVKRLQACILNPTGHVLTDLALIAIAKGQLPALPTCILLDMPRENKEKIGRLLDRFLITEDVELNDVTSQLACLSLQGPAAAQQIQQLHLGPCVIVEADHTGSGGFDIYLPRETRDTVLHSLAIPILDEPTIELLRIEAGIPKYGAELDESVIALEANLRQTHISLTKGCYVGQEIMARIESRGHTNRGLAGLVFSPNEIPERGETLYPLQEPAREVGRITSVATSSPAMDNRPIALAFVRHEFAQPNTRLHVGASQKVAVVVPLPFISTTQGLSE
ncbi:MAG TPA: glycine cleavage T C-terminal barrel domain-containing protein [Chthonomonas sp.]|uniref:CAF17-like 4Fe-4S cluster assembly/insertion protein YgfZ n=1 Tax=Chthonomonas sp. TaxID=2282153 RepID=UPI002B4AC281|nr:glycine cleavage T C-terminal barrel domain-containing protein [Chthonomonas sp.]HLI47433.1 glycine cleavage T C-terminal barrel domain-containing protein [Chthonomonas sp.]